MNWPLKSLDELGFVGRGKSKQSSSRAKFTENLAATLHSLFAQTVMKNIMSAKEIKFSFSLSQALFPRTKNYPPAFP
jgi:hypothetical protein